MFTDPSSRIKGRNVQYAVKLGATVINTVLTSSLRVFSLANASAWVISWYLKKIIIIINRWNEVCFHVLSKTFDSNCHLINMNHFYFPFEVWYSVLFFVWYFKYLNTICKIEKKSKHCFQPAKEYSFNQQKRTTNFPKYSHSSSDLIVLHPWKTFENTR